MRGFRTIVGLSLLVALGAGVGHAANDDDPFAPKAGASDQPPNPGAAPSSPTAPAAPLPPECNGVNLTEDICQQSNNGLLAKTAGYAVLAVLLFTILRMWWNRRGTSSAPVRFITPMLLAGAGAGTLSGLDPLRSVHLKCCIANHDFVTKVLLQDSEVARAVLLGVLPAFALFFVVAVLEKLLKR